MADCMAIALPLHMAYCRSGTPADRPMKTALTLDAAGRIVLPSEARRLLNLRPGSRLLLTIAAERIELVPEPEAETAPARSATGRRVLAPTGAPADAAAATRAERVRQSGPRRGR